MIRFDRTAYVIVGIALFVGAILMAIGSFGPWFMLSAGYDMPWLAIPISGLDKGVDESGWISLAIAGAMAMSGLVGPIILRSWPYFVSGVLSVVALDLVFAQRDEVIAAVDQSAYHVSMEWGSALVITGAFVCLMASASAIIDVFFGVFDA